MKKISLELKIFLLLLIMLQSCNKEDTYTDLTDEAKELVFFEVGDTFKLKNIVTDEIITLTVNWKAFDYNSDGPTPGTIFSGFGGDDYYERGEYFFSDPTDCYNGTVAVEARRYGNFKFSIFTGDCFSEYLTTFEFNSIAFEFGDEIISFSLNGIEYPETYILNSSNNTIFYTKENGILQIVDEVNDRANFIIEQ